MPEISWRVAPYVGVCRRKGYLTSEWPEARACNLEEANE